MATNERQCTIDIPAIQDIEIDIATFLNALAPVFERPCESWHIDLSTCQNIGLYAATIIAAFVLESRARGQLARITLPQFRPEQKKFLEAVGLHHILSGTPYSSDNDPSNNTISLRQISQSRFADSEPITLLVRQHAQFPEESAENLRMCVSEIVQNVQDHSASKIGAVMAARWEPQSINVV